MKSPRAHGLDAELGQPADVQALALRLSPRTVLSAGDN
jgi:hypothetical protein